MKALRTTVLTLLTAALVADCVSAQMPQRPLPRPVVAAVGVSVNGNIGVDAFYGRLGSYGHWINRPNFGWSWVPGGVAVGWRPYSVGHWAYSDYGWTWVSGEPWGWATYHYGRWYNDPDYGWSWVPGNDWGPAWVSWQQGGNYIGWAPLPPAVGFTAGVGLALGGINLGVAIGPADYCFVGANNFLAPNIAVVAFPVGRNVDVFRQTSNITRYNFEGGRIVNTGLPVEKVQQFTGRPVPRFTVANASRPTGGALRGNQLSMYRPAVSRARVEPSAAIQRDSARFVASHGHGAVAHPAIANRSATVVPKAQTTHTRPVITNRTVHNNTVNNHANVHNNVATHRPPVHNNVAVHHPPAAVHHSPAHTSKPAVTHATVNRVNSQHRTPAPHAQPPVHHNVTPPPKARTEGTPERHNPPPAEHTASRSVEHRSAPAYQRQHSAPVTQHAVAARPQPQHVAAPQHPQVHAQGAARPARPPQTAHQRANNEKRPPVQ